mgnify:FL=1
MNNNIKPQSEPLVTIIIATYNEFLNIQKTLDSIKNQKYKNTELIVIDANSDDGTVGILKKNSSEIKYFLSEDDLGIYDAWNKALNVSSGDWIMFLGAGDCLKPNALSTYIASINHNNFINFISSKGIVIDSKGMPLREFGKSFDKRAFLKYMTICHPSSLHHKSLFKDYGHFNISYKICADYDFLVRAIDSIHPKFINKNLVEVLDGGISAYSFTGLYETKLIKLSKRSKIQVEFEWFLSVIKLYIKIQLLGRAV